MPLILPSGLVPAPALFQPEEALAGGQVVGYRFDRLSSAGALLGVIDGVEGGRLSSSSANAIKTTGTLTVADLGQDIDWLNDRVRPVALIEGLGGTAGETEHPLGVYIAAAPSEAWSETGRVWQVELMDKLAILDQDIATDLDGNPVLYVAPIGANVVDLVKDLIAGTGEAVPAIEPDSKALSTSMTWDVGTPLLAIINGLLEAAGYASLWVDNLGQYRVSPYTSPAQREPVYSQEAPFVVGDRSVLSPEWTRDRDIYSIPNRYVAIGQGSGEAEAPVAVVTNTNVNSPFSYQARGRWVTRVVTGIEAASEADLETRALMGLAQASSVTSGLSIQHRFLPDLKVNDVIRFHHPDAGLDLLCYVTRIETDLSADSLCRTEIREAIV
jgi:hypothetical protein